MSRAVRLRAVPPLGVCARHMCAHMSVLRERENIVERERGRIHETERIHVKGRENTECGTEKEFERASEHESVYVRE